MPRDPNIEKANPVKLSVIEISLSKIAVSILAPRCHTVVVSRNYPRSLFLPKAGVFLLTRRRFETVSSFRRSRHQRITRETKCAKILHRPIAPNAKSP
jgi:hypothetical protein